MRLNKDLVGINFGRLLVIKKTKPKYYLCKCICGNEKEVRRDHLQTNKTTSCGCYRNENVKIKSITHGLSYNKLYFVWYSMMQRCYNKNFEDYNNYGGRGILVSEEWHDLKQFVNDVKENYSKDLQLDRINNDLGYSKNNFRWATRSDNNRNKRTNRLIRVGDEIKTAIEWSNILNIPYSTIVGRDKRGVNIINGLVL